MSEQNNHSKTITLHLNDKKYRTITTYFRSATQGCQYLVEGLNQVLWKNQRTLAAEFQEGGLAKALGKLVKKTTVPPYEVHNPETLTPLLPDGPCRKQFKEMSWGHQVAFAFQVAACLPRGYYGQLHEDGEKTRQAHFVLTKHTERELSETFSSPRGFGVLLINNLEGLLAGAIKTADPEMNLMPLFKKAQQGCLPHNPYAFGSNLRASLLELHRKKEGRGQFDTVEREALRRLEVLDPVTLFLLEVAASEHSTREGSKGVPIRHITPRASERAMAEYLEFFPNETAGGSFAMEIFPSLIKTVLYEELIGMFSVPDIKLVLQTSQDTLPTTGRYAGETIAQALADVVERRGEKPHEVQLTQKVASLPRMTRVCLELLGQNMAHTGMTLDEWSRLLGQ